MFRVLIEPFDPFYLLKDPVVGEVDAFSGILLILILEVLESDASVGEEVE
jgi:hypothetical protein